jgi:hypothetical protein
VEHAARVELVWGLQQQSAKRCPWWPFTLPCSDEALHPGDLLAESQQHEGDLLFVMLLQGNACANGIMLCCINLHAWACVTDSGATSSQHVSCQPDPKALNRPGRRAGCGVGCSLQSVCVQIRCTAWGTSATSIAVGCELQQMPRFTRGDVLGVKIVTRQLYLVGH